MNEKTEEESKDTKAATSSWSQRFSLLVKYIFRTVKSLPPPTYQKAVIGDEERVRIIAFSAGGMNNVFGFGMVHAFLVSDAPRPHIAAGTSTGAVVAATLADVLQAGDDSPNTTTGRRLIQVARFRALMEQIIKLPADFKEASLPDFTEVSARAGLVPLVLPTQKEGEKNDRNKTALARFGLTRLFNGMLLSRVKIGELTCITRLVLEIQAADEICWTWLHRRLGGVSAIFYHPCRCCVKLWTRFRIWLQILIPVIRDAPLLLRCVAALFFRVDFIRVTAESFGFKDLRNVKDILFEPWRLQLATILLFILSYPAACFGWVLAPAVAGVWLLSGGILRSFSSLKKSPKLFYFVRIGIAALWLCGAVQIVIRVKMSAYLKNVPEVIHRHTIQGIPLHLNNLMQVRHDLICLAGLAALWFVPAMVFVAVVILLTDISEEGQLLAIFLGAFYIKEDLLTTGVLRKMLMLAFDPDYYGESNFNEALNEALGGPHSRPGEPRPDADSSSDPDANSIPGQRRIADWIWKKENNGKTRERKSASILVTPIAADVATGELVPLGPNMTTIDALMAACAFTPLFAAQELAIEDNSPTRWLVDGASVASEPIQPVLDLIKQLHLNNLYPSMAGKKPFANLKLINNPQYVELCVISPYPTRRVREQERKQMADDMSPGTPHADGNNSEDNKKGPPPGTLYRVADIFALEATHAAKDERTLVTLYNAMLRKYHHTAKQALFCSSLDHNQTDRIDDWHVHANLRELEPDSPVQLMIELSRCPDETAKRSVLLRTIADGCRASLSGLYRNTLAKMAVDPQTKAEILGAPKTVVTPPCRRLQDLLKVTNKIQELPGILGDKSPPGIAEVCRECCFFRDPAGSWKKIEKIGGDTALSDWGESIENNTLRAPILPKAEPKENWPVEGKLKVPGKERPLVSLILSGGVFRGVFQVGVLNALEMAGMKPDVVAGASVGTIMAALSARVFTEPDEPQRKYRITSVAATFLAIDRLVLTDRFADFIRHFTLRAGSANFSLRDADGLFRQFDQRGLESFSRRSRKVLAGIHRLFYLDPLELVDVLSLNSPHKRRELGDRLLLFAQDALNRAGVGVELLGAEPLELLIETHVLKEKERKDHGFDIFLDHGIHFMATATNLKTGELDVLGSFCNHLRRPALIPGLLASSAFPGVFRPRMNWELRAGSPGLPEELIDGGIADNLPIIPVYRFLVYAGNNDWLTLRPKLKTDGSGEDAQETCPHLLFTASLEPRKRILEGFDLKRTSGCWFSLKERVKQLRYNVKIESHRRTQADLRKIERALEKKSTNAKDFRPDVKLPDLHVSCVTPEWLCGTFAFHPMLGFKRNRQAANIAHGCASTLAHLCWEQNHNPMWSSHWWNKLDSHPGVYAPKRTFDDSLKLNPRPVDGDGHCCFIQDKKCPFSKVEINRIQNDLRSAKSFVPLGGETIEALNEIYLACGKKKTHEKP